MAKTVITAAGIAVAGGGALLAWMGIRDYTLSNVLDAAIRGEELVPAHELEGVIRTIPKDGQDSISPATPPVGGGGSGASPKLTNLPYDPSFEGLDGINWDGGIF